MRDGVFCQSIPRGRGTAWLAGTSNEALLFHLFGLRRGLFMGLAVRMTHSVPSYAWSSRMPAVISLCVSRQAAAEGDVHSTAG